MELDEALSQIAEIRRQVTRTTLFRGYRAVPVAFSGLLAFIAGGAQAWWLPHAVIWVAVFYLATGLCCLAWAQGEASFSPWAMALPFGVGQLATAGILYWTLERAHEQA